MKGIGMATGLLAAAGLLAVPEPAAAGVRIGVAVALDHGTDYGYASGAFRAGFDRGYEDGYKAGVKDGRHDRRYSFWDEKRYRRADAGYKGWMGPKWRYQEAYRRGFEEGYRRAYARNDWDRDGGWRGDRRW
jgi:flagellar biosynthesis/type III secretory pathway protein FliH